MRILSILALVAAAQAATIQLKIDAFQLMPTGSQFALRIRMVGKNGEELPKTLRLTNLKVNNAVLDLDATTESGKVWGNLDSGLNMTNDGGIDFTSGLLIFINSGANLPPLLTFDLIDPETGQRYSADEFGIFLSEYVPFDSGFSSSFTIGASNSPGGNSFGLSEENIPPLPTPPDPNDPQNPPTNTPPDTPPPNSTIDPPPSTPEIPEPSTYLMVLSALGVISSRYSSKRGT